MAKVVGVNPPRPYPPLGSVEERQALALDLGVIARAKLSAAPATWVWTSTPPGSTTMPVACDRPAPATSGDDPAVRDADIPDLAVDPVGGIVHLPARDAQHRVYAESGGPIGAGVQGGLAAAARRMRRRTSSSVGYGERSAGRSGRGTSSMR